MIFSFEQIIPWLLHYKYIVLFPLMIIEGPIVTIIVGFLSSLGYFHLSVVYGVIIIGDLVGDSLYYVFGRWGKETLIQRWGKYIGITEERVVYLEKHFENHSGKTLLFGKLAHGVGGAVLAAAGVAKTPYTRFLWYNFLGTIPKSLLLLLIGYYFGRTYVQLNTYLDYTAIMSVLLTVVFLLLYFVMMRVGKKQENNKKCMENTTESLYPERFVNIGKGKIYYTLHMQNPKQITIIFLHGLTSNHTTWSTMMKQLAAQGYNTLALDMRGHGCSDKTIKRRLYCMSVFADDLELIIQKEHIQKYMLIGYSYGGAVALEFAIRKPSGMCGLILISTNCVTPLKYKYLSFFNPIAYGILQSVSFLLLWVRRKQYFYYRHGSAVGYWRSLWNGYLTMPISIHYWMLAQMLVLNYEPVLQKILAPTIIIRSEKDPFVSCAEAEYMKQHIPRSEMIVFRGRGHFIGSTCQDELLKVIVPFFQKYTPVNTAQQNNDK
ncbi:MAG TPA: alpha/beta fold hydrolase [Patescibacteria group bacterium]|nr:alpha/beta fold hydrolase [Patescibacteria group bacterium]